MLKVSEPGHYYYYCISKTRALAHLAWLELSDPPQTAQLLAREPALPVRHSPPHNARANKKKARASSRALAPLLCEACQAYLSSLPNQRREREKEENPIEENKKLTTREEIKM